MWETLSDEDKHCLLEEEKHGLSPRSWELWSGWVRQLQSPAGDIRGFLSSRRLMAVGVTRYAATTLLRQDALSDESRVTLLRFVRRHQLLPGWL
jgi:hypothetical protein